MSLLKELLHNTIEYLNDKEIGEVLEFAQNLKKKNAVSLTLKRLANNPTFHVPQVLGDFSQVEPIHVEDIPASELLVEDRR